MVNINEEFPSKYLKSSDLQGQVVRVTIAHVDSEEVGKEKDRRLVCYFKGKSKGMVLNKTNARTIAEVFGDETENWTGAEIEVFSMKVEYQGRMVDGIRIRIPTRRPAPVGKMSGGVEFVPNARDRAEANADNPSAPLDDEIPF